MHVLYCKILFLASYAATRCSIVSKQQRATHAFTVLHEIHYCTVYSTLYKMIYNTVYTYIQYIYYSIYYIIYILHI
jgi:hypothetical protein